MIKQVAVSISFQSVPYGFLKDMPILDFVVKCYALRVQLNQANPCICGITYLRYW
jgi:hypothetical protein